MTVATTSPIVRVSRRAWMVAAATGCNIFVVFAFSGGLNIALPAIARDLQMSSMLAPWALLGYMLTSTALILVAGRLADIVSRRTLYLAGSLGLVLATVLCAAAQNDVTLVGARVAQGIAAAFVVSSTTPLLTDAFSDRQLPVALGFNATVAALGQVSGPLFGGVLTDTWGWRSLFLIGGALLLVALLLALWSLPATRNLPERGQVDLAGAGLSIVALSSAVLFLSSVGRSTVSPSVTATAGTICVIALTLFVLQQRRTSAPLIDPGVLRDRRVLACVAVAGAGSLVSFTAPLIVSLLAQTGAGVSASEAALLILPAPIATLFATTLIGRLAARVEPGMLTLAGVGLVVLGSTAVALLVTGGAATGPWMFAALSVVGFGGGVFLTPNTTMLIRRLAPSRRGIGNALRSTFQNGGYLVGSAVALSLIDVTGPGSHARGPAAAAWVVVGVGLIAVWIAATVLWRARRGARPAAVRATEDATSLGSV